MKSLRFGIEIETVSITRKAAAEAIKSIVGGTYKHIGQPHCYDPYHVTGTDGRVWKVVADSSLSAAPHLRAEVVSPILTYKDIETVQEIVRALRQAGAKVNTSCGIHIHVDAAPFDASAVRNLVKIVNKQENLIENALGISNQRKATWCKGIDAEFLKKIEKRRTSDLSDINIAWYGYHNTNPHHYNSTRYRGLNLHNIWYRGTVEFRWFESSLHAGKVKAYLQFILALAAKALKAKATSSKKREFNAATAKYDFRVFLLGLGLIGDEFKTARFHLLGRLNGSAAWKNGRPEGR